MENPEGVLNLLDEFAKLKSKEIPSDLEEYLSYVAASGDPVYQWSLIKNLYRQKLINVITEFYEMCPIVEIPRCPNVDPFNYETMKSSLLKRLDSFSSAPFTIQRISELLTTPRKQYNRVDKFMRAIEKNIWVVSTREPGTRDTNIPQETSTSLVNGVTPRVCVTVKHPKRIKSIEDRIKSGHPQLIDDEEEEEEEEEEGEDVDEYEQMEEETNTQILTNNVVDESSLQCTSVKDLIEKYENGTIFSNSEEKTNFVDKSNNAIEEVATTTASMILTTEPFESATTTVITTTASTANTETSDSTNVITSSEISEVAMPFETQLKSDCETPTSEENKEMMDVYKDIKKLPPDFIPCHSNENTAESVNLQYSVEECEIQDSKSEIPVLNSTVDTPMNETQSTEDASLLISSCEVPMNEDNSLAMMVESGRDSMTLNIPSVESQQSDQSQDLNPILNSGSSPIWPEKSDSALKAKESL